MGVGIDVLALLIPHVLIATQHCDWGDGGRLITERLMQVFGMSRSMIGISLAVFLPCTALRIKRLGEVKACTVNKCPVCVYFLPRFGHVRDPPSAASTTN
jgi:hypothetical protein